ncbi:MAG: MFS transporter [Lentisphaerae bacterium]|nr:MFS transporter [Lentisphaerota bacterium]MCP4101658.1 MFS transporter [Lentisphaerota bacterium]
MKSKIIALLTAGHFVNDTYQGALAALLPFLITAHDLSYAAVTGILFAANIASSIVQPAIGYASDKKPCPWIIPISLLLVGGGIAALGMIQPYSMLLVAAIIGGIGMAGIHPEGARMVNAVSGKKKGLAMSWFGVGGNLGIAIGPIIATAVAYELGLKYTWILFIPAVFMALIFAFKMKSLTPADNMVKEKEEQSRLEHRKNRWGMFCILTMAVNIRSILFFAMLAFVPIFWTTILHQSTGSAGMALAAMNGAFVIGNICGGRLADEIGNELAILISTIGMVPLFPLLLVVDTPGVGLLVFAGIGFFMALSYSPSIVLGQDYLPKNIGLSSGVTLGLALSVGGITTPILGKIADIWGLKAALIIPAVLPILMLGIAVILLPKVWTYFGNRKLKPVQIQQGAN